MVNKIKAINKKNSLIIFISFFIAIYLFNYFFSDKKINFNELAITKDTSFKIEKIKDQKIICTGKEDFYDCIKFNKKNNVLLIGNSQLTGINQKKNEDFLTSYYLFKSLKKKDHNLITFALPNGSFTEFLILFEYIISKVKIKKLVLPIVFDDLREGRIRKDISNFFVDENFKLKFANSLHKKKIIKKILNEKKITKRHDNKKTIQEYTENKINYFLNYCCSHESKKLTASTKIYHNLYLLRNYVFNIKPTSKRKMIPGFYEENVNSLQEIIELSKDNGIEIYLYISPIRNDLQMPYVYDEYKDFKLFVENIAIINKINFKNFENIIPNNLWGTKPGTKLHTKNEVDFMHFKGAGHKILSLKLEEYINN